MKALKAIALAALLLAANQASALIDISGFGGYTTLNMSGVNKAIHDTVLYDGGHDVTEISNGFYVGADAGISVLPFLKIGPRLEYVGANQGKGTYGSPAATFTLDSNLLLLELGLSCDSSLPLTGLSVQGGVWGGYGMAHATFTQSGDNLTGSGNGFCGEIAAQARYKLLAGLCIGLDLGYRMANIATVSIDSGPYTGDPLIVDDFNHPEGFDFSGFNVGGSVSYNF